MALDLRPARAEPSSAWARAAIPHVPGAESKPVATTTLTTIGHIPPLTPTALAMMIASGALRRGPA